MGQRVEFCLRECPSELLTHSLYWLYRICHRGPFRVEFWVAELNTRTVHERKPRRAALELAVLWLFVRTRTWLARFRGTRLLLAIQRTMFESRGQFESGSFEDCHYYGSTRYEMMRNGIRKWISRSKTTRIEFSCSFVRVKNWIRSQIEFLGPLIH